MQRVKWREVAVIIALVTIVVAVVVLPALQPVREWPRPASCQNNLKQMGLVFAMYANESPGELWPPRSPIPRNWIPDMNAVYPEYLTDLQILVCPDNPNASTNPLVLKGSREHPPAAVGVPHPDCASSASYTYTGRELRSEAEALDLYNHFPDGVAKPLRGADLWNGATEDPEALREGAELPVMWDRVPPSEGEFAHRKPLGIHVLYAAGNVSFVPYLRDDNAERFPATQDIALTFGSDVPRLSVDCP